MNNILSFVDFVNEVQLSDLTTIQQGSYFSGAGTLPQPYHTAKGVDSNIDAPDDFYKKKISTNIK